MGYTIFKNLPDTDTPLSAEILNAMQKGLMELVFPIGSTYITQVDTNPSEILEFGTWERLRGKVCLGLDEDDTDFNEIGKIGGEKEHTLTLSELPVNQISTTITDGTHVDGFLMRGGYNNDGQNYNIGGSGQAHNNMPPYEVVGYMWIRRA